MTASVELGDDETLPHVCEPPPSEHGSSDPFTKPLHRIHRRQLKCRQQTRDQTACQGYREREQEDVHVQLHVLETGQRSGRPCRQDLQNQAREYQPGAGRQDREDDVLGENEPDEARPAGAKRSAQRELVHARGASREHEVGDVRARDQKDEGHGTEQQPERPLRARPNHLVRQALNQDAASRIGIGVVVTKARGDHVELRASRLDRCQRRQAADDHQHVGVAASRVGLKRFPVAHHRDRLPQLDVLVRELEAVGHDADDLARRAIDIQRRSENRGIAGEALPPQTVADDDRPLRAAKVRGVEGPAEHGWGTEHLKESRTDQRDVDPFRFLPACDRRTREFWTAIDRHVLELTALLPSSHEN